MQAKVQETKKVTEARQNKTTNLTSSKQQGSASKKNIQRTQVYAQAYYYAAKSCENTIKIGKSLVQPYYCLIENLRNPYYIMKNGVVNGTLPYLYALQYDTLKPKLGLIMNSPQGWLMAAGLFEVASQQYVMQYHSALINDEMYKFYITGE